MHRCKVSDGSGVKTGKYTLQNQYPPPLSATEGKAVPHYHMTPGFHTVADTEWGRAHSSPSERGETRELQTTVEDCAATGLGTGTAVPEAFFSIAELNLAQEYDLPDRDKQRSYRQLGLEMPKRKNYS
ncbi:hypothetical protein NDU88_005377 [Pleurodeles waltl]|uniref:Uncharacterized protein n=1 Tax=Pleurodeles waltl TaxID=8319 RepID=A0AAV7MXP6_PLEWA|nr:hypothetical protein NDU88_005377 [Pleurodeles waltl]